MNKLRLFEAFAGYGSQAMALKRLGVDFELVGWSEFDPDSKQPIDKQAAVIAHNAVHPEGKGLNYGDISTIDWSIVPDFDMFTYSFPCQDISNAGIQRGLEEGSGTRSSLLWECQKAIEAKKPKYLLMENVKALTSKKFLPYLNKWEQYLARLGYSNFIKVLNAKDYGVPQNRERVFMVSILGGESFHFPQKIELKTRLKDVLEKNVDEKYYLKQSTVESFKHHCDRKQEEGCGFKFEPTDGNVIAHTVKTTAGSRETDNFIKESKKYGNKRVQSLVDSGKISGNMPKVIGKEKEPFIYQRPRGYMKGNIQKICPSITISQWQSNNILVIPEDRIVCEQRNDEGLCFFKDNICGTLRTIDACGDKRVIEHKIYDIIYPNGYVATGVVTFDKTKDDFRIRKLTPRECFRLMGVSDEDIDKIQDSGISNSQQYKLAGNSIVVDVLYHIFRKLLVEKENEEKQLTLF